jgi:hypothetical protein
MHEMQAAMCIRPNQTRVTLADRLQVFVWPLALLGLVKEDGILAPHSDEDPKYAQAVDE